MRIAPIATAMLEVQGLERQRRGHGHYRPRAEKGRSDARAWSAAVRGRPAGLPGLGGAAVSGRLGGDPACASAQLKYTFSRRLLAPCSTSSSPPAAPKLLLLPPSPKALRAERGLEAEDAAEASLPDRLPSRRALHSEREGQALAALLSACRGDRPD